MNQLFEVYSPKDIDIVRIASKYNMYLIGGTAIDFLCNNLGIKNWRNRSINDIDFYTFPNNKGIKQFGEYLNFIEFDKSVDEQYMKMFQSKTDSNFTVDILIDYDSYNKKFFTKINGINVMHPVWLFMSKFDRYLSSRDRKRRQIDERDLIVLLKIIDKFKSIDMLEQELQRRDYSYSDEVELNKIIEQV